MKRILLLLVFIIYSCTNDTCICTEITTNIRVNRSYINEYAIECDNPYTILETYEWGNVVTDCR